MTYPVEKAFDSRRLHHFIMRTLSNCGQVFRYAIATGRTKHDPSGDLRGALPPVTNTHLAATANPQQVAEILRAMDGYEGTLTVRCALQLASRSPHTWSRLRTG